MQRQRPDFPLIHTAPHPGPFSGYKKTHTPWWAITHTLLFEENLILVSSESPDILTEITGDDIDPNSPGPYRGMYTYHDWDHYIWLSPAVNNIELTVVHETSHLIDNVFERTGLSCTEVRAYMLEYTVNRIITLLRDSHALLPNIPQNEDVKKIVRRLRAVEG